MALLPWPALALLLLVLTAALRCQEEAQSTDWRTTLKTIRNGVHKIDTYLNAALDLLGGEDGLCQYRCSDGEGPASRAAGAQGVGRERPGGPRRGPLAAGTPNPCSDLAILVTEPPGSQSLC